MNIKKYFDNINLDHIKGFIDELQEENLFLEFKTVNFPEKTGDQDHDRKNLSKCISGFANSDGGIVVWGVKAKENKNKQDVATELKPIKELTKFLNWLNRQEGQVTTPGVKGIIHKKILDGEDEGFVKTYIPPSENAPHMAIASDKRYFKRNGDSFYPCEHYDIRDMFNRIHNGSIDIKVDFFEKNERFSNTWEYSFLLKLTNISSGLAKSPFIKIEVNHPFTINEFGIDGNRGIGIFGKKDIRGPKLDGLYVGKATDVIFPGIEYPIDKISLMQRKELIDLPLLYIKYIIVAEHMDKLEKQLKIDISKLIPKI